MKIFKQRRNRNVLHVLLAFFIVSFLCPARQSPHPVYTRTVRPEKNRDQRLEEAIVRALGNTNQTDGPIFYNYNRVALNRDPHTEVIAYVFGQAACGTGGCMALIFETQGAEYNLISQIALARTPILVGSHQSHGWKDLILFVAGGGVQPGYYAVLPFDGRQYPDNPTAPPAKRLTYPEKATAYLVNGDNHGFRIPVSPPAGQVKPITR